ncbi:MAG: hypothetical protein M3377_06820 [Actinomycetota bacterium]|nr:hypothetical protein [Actinomycetota bacterium]
MTQSQTRERDEFLGAALRELEVPDHAPEFYAELHRRLAEERMDRLDAARARRRARQTRMRWGIRVGGIAAAAAVLAAAIGLPRIGDRVGPRVGVETATAAEIKAKVAAALARAQSLSGQLVSIELNHETGERETVRWTFAVTAGGDFRLHGLNRREELAYDAARGIERSYQVFEDGFTAATERKGLAPGRPDPSPQDWILQRRLGSVVRALLAARDPRVSEATYRNREAWRLSLDVEPNKLSGGASADHLDITVDKETGIPVRVVESVNGEFLRELRMAGLRVDREFPRGHFTFAFPEGIDVFRSDDHFRRVDVDELESLVDYDPLIPTTIPDGYELTEIAFAPNGLQTGTEGMNPPSEQVISLSYRRGLDQFLVTTRLRGPECPAPAEGCPRDPLAVWGDPLASGEGFLDRPERITFSRGALRGARAELLIDPRAIPHVWALTAELVVTVSGDLSRGELIAVAETLS